MEIQKIDLSRLRNEEHYSFHNETNDLVLRFTAEALGIQRFYPAYEAAFAAEGEVLDLLQKSLLTGPIADADTQRDLLFSGLKDTVKGAEKHFNPAVAEAARRTSVLLDSFGDISNKGYNEETAALKSLVSDLENQHAADVATLDIADWVSELKARNTAFEALLDERYTEEATKNPLKMKDARKQLDATYDDITRLIDALALVNGPETYEGFIKELNKRVEKYNTIVEQRKGRNKKDEPEEV
ncbi:DUF6261 family protein [Maribellus sp. YY47]|uniref:DUF6261 family protein n=1 Tax=Maribellus sp. YY47 TaxID=2929486 RepID=UPI002000F2AA|nr:DUF6261 family protein [Maribellus sp. YY47]MCK3685839.1 DUF6261 family protein [Maribellus sp. YY47]